MFDFQVKFGQQKRYQDWFQKQVRGYLYSCKDAVSNVLDFHYLLVSMKSTSIIGKGIKIIKQNKAHLCTLSECLPYGVLKNAD